MMKPFILAACFVATSFAGEPTLISGKAVRFQLGVDSLWFGKDSSATLSKIVNDDYDTPYDIFNTTSESADIYVSKVWPEKAVFTLTAVFEWSFSCDLIKTSEGLAKTNLVSGPCGAGWQVDTVSNTVAIRSLGIWTPLRTNSIKDSVAEKKNRMSSYEARLSFSLAGADSVEITVANWKTDKNILAVPETSTVPEFLTLRGNCGSNLHVENLEIPTRIDQSKRNNNVRNSTATKIVNHSAQFMWNSSTLDALGRSR